MTTPREQFDPYEEKTPKNFPVPDSTIRLPFVHEYVLRNLQQLMLVRNSSHSDAYVFVQARNDDIQSKIFVYRCLASNHAHAYSRRQVSGWRHIKEEHEF